MRIFLVAAAALVLAGCGAPPESVQKAKPDVTTEAWYGQAVEQVAAAGREAERLFRQGKADDAAGVMTRVEPVTKRVLEVPRPTLAAMEAASDLDDLYGRMLLRNRHYGWARLSFQKNVVRWKYWSPQTPESKRRLREAHAGIAECDRLLALH